MNIPFIQAAHFTPGRGGVIPHIVVMHTMQTPETKSRARQVWQWFAGKTAPQASAHYCIDFLEVLQNVKDTDTAWAVDDWVLNQASISIELAGSASQTPAQWADTYSKAELALAAKLVAQKCKQFNIHPVRLSTNDILTGKSGICGHADITAAKKIAGGHTDPGKNFPWTSFIADVTTQLKALG